MRDVVSPEVMHRGLPVCGYGPDEPVRCCLGVGDVGMLITRFRNGVLVGTLARRPAILLVCPIFRPRYA